MARKLSDDNRLNQARFAAFFVARSSLSPLGLATKGRRPEVESANLFTRRADVSVKDPLPSKRLILFLWRS